MEPFMKPIKITQPLLPVPDEFDQKIREIWDSRQLSNCGRMAARSLRTAHHAEALSVANGTLALNACGNWISR